MPYGQSTPSLIVAAAALRHADEILAHIPKIIRERDRLQRVVEDAGFTTWHSEANFVLFVPPDAATLKDRLLARGLMVRDLSRAVPGSLRVTAGLPEHTDAFAEVVSSVT